MVICLVGGYRLHLESAPPIIIIPKRIHASYSIFRDVAVLCKSVSETSPAYDTWWKDGLTWDSAWGCLVHVYKPAVTGLAIIEAAYRNPHATLRELCKELGITWYKAIELLGGKPEPDVYDTGGS